MSYFLQPILTTAIAYAKLIGCRKRKMSFLLNIIRYICII